MRRRSAALVVVACLVGSVALGACGSDSKKQAPATSTTQTTVQTAPSRDGGGGKDNGNSGAGNVGGATNGPNPGANNYGG